MGTKTIVASRGSVIPALVCILVALSSCQSKQPSKFDGWAGKDISTLLAVTNEQLELIEKSDPTSEDVARLRSLNQQQHDLYAKYHEHPPEPFIPTRLSQRRRLTIATGDS